MHPAAIVPTIVNVASPSHDDLVRVLKRERSQQNGIDDTKDRAVRANPESEREDGDDGEPGRFDQHSQGVF